MKKTFYNAFLLMQGWYLVACTTYEDSICNEKGTGGRFLVDDCRCISHYVNNLEMDINNKII